MRLLVRRKRASVISQKRKNSKIEVKTQKIQEPIIYDSYDPHLRPLSTIYYEEIGARIYDPRIVNMAGEKSIDL